MASDRSTRIRTISREIAALSAELEQLLSLDEASSQPTPSRRVSPPRRSGSFQVGDIVRITNKYGGNFNKRGRVLRVTRDSVDLHLLDDQPYTTVTKRKRNVILLTASSQ